MPVTALPGRTTLAEVHAAAARRLGRTPWGLRHPAPLADVRIVPDGERWRVSDVSGSLPVADGSAVWALLAVSGGEPVDVFGEVESGTFRPLAVWLDDGVMGL